MAWIKQFVNTQDPRVMLRAASGGKGGKGFVSNTWNRTKYADTPDARNLREWTRTNGFIKAAMTVRRNQISTADWDVIVTTPNLSEGEQAAAEAACARAKALFNAPNPTGKNNSFQNLLDPLTDDFLAIGVNCLMKTQRLNGEVAALETVDAARLKVFKNWRSEKDGPRYVIMNEDGRTGKVYHNNELVTMFYDPVTYDELGTPPLRALHSRLISLQQTFESVSELQANRIPPKFVNFAGMDDPGLERMKRMLQNEILGQSTVAFFNYPLDDVSTIDLGSMDLQEQGVAWFVDWMIREICAAFRVTTLQLNWTQDQNRSTAKEQIKMSLDDGVVPVMKIMAGYLNTEVVSTFGNPNISFVWTELVSHDEPVDAAILEKQAGPLVYMSINELRIAAGLDPVKLKPDDPLFPWYNDPWCPTYSGQLAPLSVAAKMAEYQPAVQDAAANAAVATHNRAEQDAKNPPEQPTPQQAKDWRVTLEQMKQERNKLMSMVEAQAA